MRRDYLKMIKKNEQGKLYYLHSRNWGKAQYYGCFLPCNNEFKKQFPHEYSLVGVNDLKGKAKKLYEHLNQEEIQRIKPVYQELLNAMAHKIIKSKAKKRPYKRNRRAFLKATA